MMLALALPNTTDASTRSFRQRLLLIQPLLEPGEAQRSSS
jgi:hypothetical protein